jgi:hypothetical protein
MERLRYLLALMLVLFPLLTLLPVFLVFWAGRVFVDDTFGLLAAQLYPVAPAIGLLVGHLDFALFPLCVAGIAVPFAIGVSRNRPVLLLLSAVVFVLYFTLTLAALSVLVFLAAYLGLVMLRRLRGRERIVRVTLDGLRVGGVFALVSILLLLVVCLWLPFDPVERYGYARLVQRDFVTTEYNLFWATTNLLGYFVSFGLMQTVLLVLQQGQALRRVWRATDGAIDDLAIAWLCLIVALVAFGRQHGETNRLWTFLTPVACLVVGTYVYERLSSRYLWVPLVAAFGLLIIGRHYLSYF